jgi:succinate dehydrogenase/fumarate reductase flavoprotein subunit
LSQDECGCMRSIEIALELAARLKHVTDRSLIWNTDLIETLELDNLVVQAVVTVKGALNRCDDIGCVRGQS